MYNFLKTAIFYGKLKKEWKNIPRKSTLRIVLKKAVQIQSGYLDYRLQNKLCLILLYLQLVNHWNTHSHLEKSCSTTKSLSLPPFYIHLQFSTRKRSYEGDKRVPRIDPNVWQVLIWLTSLNCCSNDGVWDRRSNLGGELTGRKYHKEKEA